MRLLCLLAVALLAAAPVYSRQLKFDSPTSKPTAPKQSCVDAYNDVMDTGCRNGAKVADCCSALAGLGKSCLESVYQYMQATPDSNAKSFAFLQSILEQCTTSSSPSTNGPSKRCVDDFNAMVDSGVCGKGASQSECCSALSEVGGACLEDIAAAMRQEPDKYADTLDALESLVQKCGLAGSSTTPSVDDKCIEGLTAAFDNGGGCAGNSQAACCNDLESLGKDCLESLLALTKQENITIHNAFVDLLQSCGWTITTSNSGTRAAAQVTAQAMVRMQAVGTAKLAAVPHTERRALAESTIRKLEQPAAQVAATAFSKTVSV